MTGALAGKTAFVSGGSGAIGAASALALAKDGAALLLMSRGREALEATRTRLLEAVPGARIALFAGDACVPQEVEAALAQGHALQGRLDILVLTVGQGQFRPLLLHSPETFRAELDRNILSAFLGMRYGAPLMEPGGAIVCISSVVATRPTPWMSAYSTAKGGLESLVRAAAEELGAAGIRVNAVKPGLTRSHLRQAMFEDAALMKVFLEEIPLGRAGEPEDTAAAVRYLAGPESSWVTGQSLGVDGGSELRKNPDLFDRMEAQFGAETMSAIRHGKNKPL